MTSCTNLSSLVSVRKIYQLIKPFLIYIIKPLKIIILLYISMQSQVLWFTVSWIWICFLFDCLRTFEVSCKHMIGDSGYIVQHHKKVYTIIIIIISKKTYFLSDLNVLLLVSVSSCSKDFITDCGWSLPVIQYQCLKLLIWLTTKKPTNLFWPVVTRMNSINPFLLSRPLRNSWFILDSKICSFLLRLKEQNF